MPKQQHFPSRADFRAWLEENHDKEMELWLVYYKKHTKRPTISYEESVCEALCFGWIDGKVRTIDDERFMQRYTPRKKNSRWSELNKKRAEKMIAEGSMTDAGMRTIEHAKSSGKWDEAVAYADIEFPDAPPELWKAFDRNKTAKAFFDNLANSYRKMYIAWVAFAKRPETKAKRIAEVVRRCELNEKPGML